TDMSQPLGHAIGNSNEVIEAIETLKGNGPDDITELALQLASYMIFAGEKASSPEEGYAMAKEALHNGKALEKLGAFIQGQNGNAKVIEDYGLFPQPAYEVNVVATKELMGNETQAYVTHIDARMIGLASQHTGAGRATKEDVLDLSAGIYLHKKRGDQVAIGEVLASVYSMDLKKAKRGCEEVEKGFSVSREKPEKRPIVLEIIRRK
ncbi:MAG: pyrimidine-nucleoside phosphorylase, partial [Anaerovorax sp.]